MALSPAFLDELRSRTSLSGLIGKTLKLQRAGREFKACCPFHQEKTASFFVVDEKQFYHCQGCGAHGDAIRWLTDARGMAFLDAVKDLADAAGMQMPARDPRDQERADRAAPLYEVMEAAAAWFHDQLWGIGGAEARRYLLERGIAEATTIAFRFGFAPDDRGRLRSALRTFGEDRLVEAGLLVRPDDRDPYDRFRSRIVFPIRDPRGRVIAFGGRILGAGEPKYLNSPDTPLFDKGRVLFNLDRAAAASRKAGRLVVVEGNLDVAMLDQAGIPEVVAPMGTTLTERQIGLMWRLNPVPILCFDGDPAGQKAAIRAAQRALPGVGPGRSLEFVTLPAGQDPDDLIRSSGVARLEQLLAKPQPLVDRLWRHELEAEPIETPEARAGLRQRLLDLASAIADDQTREQYRAEFMRRFGEIMQPRAPAPQQKGRNMQRRPISAAAKQLGKEGLGVQMERAILQGLVRFPAIVTGQAEAIGAIPISDETLARARDRMLDRAMTTGDLRRGDLDDLGQWTEGPALGFSFVRGAEAEVAARDLALVIDVIQAKENLSRSIQTAPFEQQADLRRAMAQQDKKLSDLIG